MDDREYLLSFTPFLKFITELCGPAVEAVMWDLSDPDHSLIAIENGYHSKRRIGKPLPDFVDELLQTHDHDQQEYITNYVGKINGKDYLNSSYFIKRDGRLIGILCVNRNMTSFQEAQKSLNILFNQFNLGFGPNIKPVIIDSSADQDFIRIIHKEILDYNVAPDKMKKQDKINILQRLKDDEVLELPGALSEAAVQLQISIPTIYRYLKELK